MDFWHFSLNLSLVKEFAGEGLRTLALAYKDLDEDMFDEWMKKLLFASTTLENREERLGDLYEEIEQGLMVRADPCTACVFVFLCDMYSISDAVQCTI